MSRYERAKYLWLFCVVLIMTIVSTSFYTCEVTAASDVVQELADGITSDNIRKAGVNTIAEWVDSKLTEGAGTTSEWYILGLIQDGQDCDYSAYRQSLENYIGSKRVENKVSRLKLCLSLLAVGAEDGYIRKLEDNAVGGQGLMSWVFGLHLMNNGYQGSKYSPNEVIEEINKLQLMDGGWAISGDMSDIDATAMVLQALAPHYEDYRSFIDSAVNLLSDRQLSSGGYLSYGTENAESTAQVIIALAALNIDCLSDKRFIKNNNTPLDALTRYCLKDGSFSHIEKGESNHFATIQAFCALISLKRQQEGQGSFYIIDKVSTNRTGEAVLEGGMVSDIRKPSDYKLTAIVIVVIAAIAASAALWLLKRRNKGNFIAAAICAAMAVIFILLTDFQSAESYYTKQAPTDMVTGTVTLSINCSQAIGSLNSEYIPDDGEILEPVEFDIVQTDTVYSVLTAAAREYEIQLDSSGISGYEYVSGINYLYEFELGDLSGWVYLVNGQRPSVGCGSFRPVPGDTIEWIYTLDGGQDIAAGRTDSKW